MALSAEHKEKMRLGRIEAAKRREKAKPAKVETAPQIEAAPAWALRLVAAVDQVVARLDAVEKKQESQLGVIARANPSAPLKKGARVYRCECCPERFEGPDPWKEGDPFLCEYCRQPGLVARYCSKCDAERKAPPGVLSDDFVCRACAKCPVCGSGGEDDIVCKRCTQGVFDPKAQVWIRKVYTCQGCGRKAHQMDTFCKKCRREYNEKAASNFRVPVDTTPQVAMGEVVPDMDIGSRAVSNAPYQQPTTVIATADGPRVITAGMAPASMG